ncbi:MAG: hypothetical protein II039_00310, partial [Treponema sp.]|nr:hypothetical protein [Treponema sp.]
MATNQNSNKDEKSVKKTAASRSASTRAAAGTSSVSRATRGSATASSSTATRGPGRPRTRVVPEGSTRASASADAKTSRASTRAGTTSSRAAGSTARLANAAAERKVRPSVRGTGTTARLAKESETRASARGSGTSSRASSTRAGTASSRSTAAGQTRLSARSTSAREGTLSSSGTSSASSSSSRRPTSSYSRTAAGTTLGATSLNATSLSAGSEASSRPYSSSLYSQSQRSSSDLSTADSTSSGSASYSEDSTISSYNTTSESSFQTSASHANDEDTTFEMASYGSSSSGSSSESGKTYEKNYENQSGYIKPKKPVNKKLIAGLACAIAAIGIGGGVGGWLYSTRDVRAARKAERLALEQQRQEKENTIALIQTYSSQGLYDNSLSLINGLLLKDNQDTDGNSLFNTTAQLKKDSDPHAGFSGQTFTDPFGNESYDSSKHSNAISIAQRYVDTALYDDASTVLNALLVDNPEDDEAKQMLDMAMTFRERASEETLKAEAEQAASDRQNALKQANDAVDSGLYDQAIAVLEALAAKDPNDAEVRSLLEKASFLKEEADKAEAARNARLAKEEAEQAEKERKANEAAANQALKDQLAARASLSNEGNAGQNPPVYSEMANVITPSS